MKKIFIVLFCLLLTMGCDKVKDIDYKDKPDVEIVVNQVDLDKAIENQPASQERQKELDQAEEKKLEEERLLVEQRRLVYVTSPVLNVREKPESEAEVVAEVNRGTKINAEDRVLDPNGVEWIKFQTEDGKTGYVAAEFTSREEPGSSIGTFRSAIVGLNVRSQPNTESDIVGELGLSEEVEGFEKIEVDDEIWIKIHYGDQDAYVNRDYLIEIQR